MNVNKLETENGQFKIHQETGKSTYLLENVSNLEIIENWKSLTPRGFKHFAG